jgi:hypothetical protein
VTKRHIKKYTETKMETSKVVKDVPTIFVKIYDCIISLRNYFPIQFLILWYHRHSKVKEREKLIVCEGNIVELLIFGDILLGLVTVCLNSKDYIPLGIINFLLIVAIVRITDIIIYQMFAIRVSKPSNVKSIVRIIFLIFVNYIEIIIWFAFFYQFMSKFDSSFVEISHSFIDSLYYSLSNIVLLGDSNITPNLCVSKIVISLQILLGLFIIVIAVSRFVTLLSEKKVKYKDETEDFKYPSTSWLAIYIFIWFLIFLLVNVFTYYIIS